MKNPLDELKTASCPTLHPVNCPSNLRDFTRQCHLESTFMLVIKAACSLSQLITWYKEWMSQAYWMLIPHLILEIYLPLILFISSQIACSFLE